MMDVTVPHQLNRYIDSITKEQKEYIEHNTIKDSGILYMTSWHSKCNTLKVTYETIKNYGGVYGALRSYTLTQNNKTIIVSSNILDIIEEYSKILLDINNNKL